MKQRKKVVLSPHERCKAIINNGKQCSRRKKYDHFCGKHNKKQPYGCVSKNVSTIMNQNLIEVRPIHINGGDYLIDKNHIIFSKEGTLIVGIYKDNKMIKV